MIRRRTRIGGREFAAAPHTRFGRGGAVGRTNETPRAARPSPGVIAIPSAPRNPVPLITPIHYRLRDHPNLKTEAREEEGSDPLIFVSVKGESKVFRKSL